MQAAGGCLQPVREFYREYPDWLPKQKRQAETEWPAHGEAFRPAVDSCAGKTMIKPRKESRKQRRHHK
jgi:hypothetical protein